MPAAEGRGSAGGMLVGCAGHINSNPSTANMVYICNSIRRPLENEPKTAPLTNPRNKGLSGHLSHRAVSLSGDIKDFLCDCLGYVVCIHTLDAR